jgi:hypothetical protein
MASSLLREVLERLFQMGKSNIAIPTQGIT